MLDLGFRFDVFVSGISVSKVGGTQVGAAALSQCKSK